jgi:hypothetical protein
MALQAATEIYIRLPPKLLDRASRPSLSFHHWLSGKPLLLRFGQSSYTPREGVLTMTVVEYSAPAIQKVADFQESTQGLWFGKFTDVFGGRAVIRIIIET